MKKYSRKQKSIGIKLKRYRKEKNITQEELSYIVGISSSYIGFIEQNRRTPSINTLDKIARALGIRLSDLLD